MRRLLVFCVCALAAVSCTSDPVAESAADEEQFIVEAEPTPSTFDASDTDQLAGVTTNPADIEAGDCFNEYVYRDGADFLQQITTMVGCNGLHDREAYFVAQYPGDEDAPAPQEDVMRDWAAQVCLDEFEDFVGLEYVLSKLEIGAIVPTFDGWTDNGDRNVICFVYPDEAGQRLLTSVRNSGL